MLAMGIIIPVLPKLVVDFIGGDTQEAARIFGLFGTAWALMQFLFSPLQGALSDSFGRRPVILISNFGVGLDYVLMALAPTLGWLFAGRRDFRHRLVEHRHGLCLRRRRDAAGQARRAFRSARGCLRRRLCARSGARRLGRQHFAAVAVLDRRRLEPGQCRFTAFSSCRNRCRRRSASASTWRRANPFGALALLRTHAVLLWLAARQFPRQPRPRRAAERERSVHDVSLRLGRAAGRPDARRRRRRLDHGAGRVVGPVIKTIGERAALHGRSWHSASRDFWCSAWRATGVGILSRHSADGAMGAGKPGIHGA